MSPVACELVWAGVLVIAAVGVLFAYVVLKEIDATDWTARDNLENLTALICKAEARTAARVRTLERIVTPDLTGTPGGKPAGDPVAPLTLYSHDPGGPA